jgi:hypothetical protein
MELEDRLTILRVRPFSYVLDQQKILGQVLFYPRDFLHVAPGEQLSLLL